VGDTDTGPAQDGRADATNHLAVAADELAHINRAARAAAERTREQAERGRERSRALRAGIADRQPGLLGDVLGPPT
jgi:phosphoglycerate-specific signal transduction histidine kinase